MSVSQNRVHINSKNAVSALKLCILKLVKKLNLQDKKNIIIFCIGTDRSTGDCLGPMTGTILNEDLHSLVEVFGTLNKPVHAKNLNQKIDFVNKKFTNPFIIAIDAGLGKQSSVGYIDVREGPLEPGTGVNKNLNPIGDMHITGLVNVGGYMEYLVLQSTRLNLVVNMAKIIAQSIYQALKHITKKYLNKKRRTKLKS